MFSFNFNNKYFFYTKVNHIVEVWQKTTKFCKATILQLKNKLIKCTHVQESLDMYKRNPENHISSAVRKHSFILIFCCPLTIETVGRSFCFRGEPLAQSLGHFCTRRHTGLQAFMWQILNSMRRTESGGAVLKTRTGGSTPLLCLEGVPDLPVAPQDEAGLTKTFQTWPRGWFHIP